MMFYHKTMFLPLFALALLVSPLPTHTMLVTEFFSQNKPDLATLIINDVSQKTGYHINPPDNFLTAAVHIGATVLAIPPTAIAATYAGPLGKLVMSAIGGTIAFSIYRQGTTDGKLMPVYQLINAQKEVIECTHADMQKMFNELKKQPDGLSQATVSRLIKQAANNPFESIITLHESINTSLNVIATIRRIAEHHQYTPLLEHALQAHDRIKLLIAEAEEVFKQINNVYRPPIEGKAGAAAA